MAKNALFLKSAKQNVRQTDKKAGKKRSKGLKNWLKMVKCVPLCSHQSFNTRKGVFLCAKGREPAGLRGEDTARSTLLAPELKKSHILMGFFIAI